MKQQVKYYIWSNQEFLGSVRELNYSTALQKAKLIARLHGKSTYAVSTSSIPNDRLIALGSTAHKKEYKLSNLEQIAKILSQRAA